MVSSCPIIAVVFICGGSEHVSNGEECQNKMHIVFQLVQTTSSFLPFYHNYLTQTHIQRPKYRFQSQQRTGLV